MRNQGVIYLGLFLMMAGIYAAEVKKSAHAEVKAVPHLQESTPVPAPQNRIQLLYEKLSALKMFSNTVEGVRLIPVHPPIKDSFTIILYGDEIFSDEDFAAHDTWNTVLDKIAYYFKNEPGLRIEISGYADLDNEKERKSSDYGASAYAFSYARAEWLAHYFERKHGIPIADSFVLRGMGAVHQGKKITLKFYFRSSLSDENSGAD